MRQGNSLAVVNDPGCKEAQRVMMPSPLTLDPAPYWGAGMGGAP